MMDEPPQDGRPGDEELERWREAARGRAPPPSGEHAWSELFEPLSDDRSERMIEGALTRARAVQTEVAERPGEAIGGAGEAVGGAAEVVSLSSRRRSLGWAIAGVVAVAAGLVLTLRATVSSPGTLGGLHIEMHGRAELRAAKADAGETDARAPVELHLRNETGWIIRAEHVPGLDRTLYLVAHEPGQAPRPLEARIDAQRGAFRVRGEVGSLGLEPGDATVYFVLGPRDASDEALRVAQAAIDGKAPPSRWSVDARRIRVLK